MFTFRLVFGRSHPNHIRFEEFKLVKQVRINIIKVRLKKRRISNNLYKMAAFSISAESFVGQTIVENTFDYVYI